MSTRPKKRPSRKGRQSVVFALLFALFSTQIGVANEPVAGEPAPTAAPATPAPPAQPRVHAPAHTRLTAKEVKARNKKFWKNIRRCAFHVIWVGSGVFGSFFWGVPAAQDYFKARQQRADMVYSESLLPKRMVTYGNSGPLIEADMKRVAVYLIPRITWDQLYRILLEVDEDGGDISRYAEELGLPKDLLHDSRTWGLYFRATPDMDAIAKLLGRALTRDWFRYREALGPEFAEAVTLQDLLIREVEKGQEEN